MDYTPDILRLLVPIICTDKFYVLDDLQIRNIFMTILFRYILDKTSKRYNLYTSLNIDEE